jgi:hypothetical protein
MRYLIIALVLLFASLPAMAIDVGLNGKFFAGVAYDFYTGAIMSDNTVYLDGDAPEHYGLAADLRFSALFNEGLTAAAVLRADNLNQDPLYLYDIHQNSFGQYYLTSKDSRKKINTELNQVYINWPGFLGFSNVVVGKYELRLGDGGEYNLFKSGFYPTSHIAWLNPTGIMLERNLFSALGSKLFAGVGDSDNAIFGLSTSYHSLSITALAESNSYDVGRIFGDNYLNNMPSYWRAEYAIEGRFSSRGPFSDTRFGHTIHVGAEFSHQFGSRLNLTTLFAYHYFKDVAPENHDYTGGSIVQFYPELMFSLKSPLKILVGAFAERYAFNDPDVHPFKAKNTFAYTVFSEARIDLRDLGYFGFMFEFAQPDTKSQDVSSTPQAEQIDYHYSLTPHFVLHPVETVDLESYFTYSLWDKSWDDPTTNYNERVVKMLGFKVRTTF